MKIIIAPDSYKGALRAPAVANALAAGWAAVRPDDEIITIPMSDGGEGLCEVLVNANGGSFMELPCHDALVRPRMARVGVIGDTAVLETAEANGIELLTRDELNPEIATTYGVGELLRQLVEEHKFKKIIAGIGGSATVDAGLGMLQALGAKFFTADGNELPAGAGGGSLAKIVRAEMVKIDCEILVACDVTNPLTGANGSAAVFGPQKGATPEMVKTLDAGLANFAGLFGDGGKSPGDGAAGGLGFALRRILGAKLIPGAELVMEETGFVNALDGASLVITGEGCSDEQTVCGKLCARIADTAAAKGVSTVLCSGALRGDVKILRSKFSGCFSISSGPSSLEEAISKTAENLEDTANSLAGFYNSASY